MGRGSGALGKGQKISLDSRLRALFTMILHKYRLCRGARCLLGNSFGTWVREAIDSYDRSRYHGVQND